MEALPVVPPVNFGLLGDSIVFRTIPATKLHTATKSNVVAFEVSNVVAFEVDSYEPNCR